MWGFAGSELRAVLHWCGAESPALSAESGWTTWCWRPWEDHGGTVDTDQIRAPLRMTSGPPQGATQSQQPGTLDRWVQCRAPPQHKSHAIEVTGKNPPLDKFTAQVDFGFLHSAGPRPHHPNILYTLPYAVFDLRWALLQQAPRYLSLPVELKPWDQRLVLLLQLVQWRFWRAHNQPVVLLSFLWDTGA